MAVDLKFLLILPGLSGIYSITTVSKMSMKAGASITVPCLYDSQYRNHVKYLCKGSSWLACSAKVRTDTQGRSTRFSISDDESQRIFTVTIKRQTSKGDYWCAVEIDGEEDVRENFRLSVTRGTPRLHVDHQEITGFNGEEITINCHYRNPGEMKWCRLGSSCVTGSSGSIDGTAVTINASVPKVFTVTLRTESSGWYYCVNGDFQMPVHVIVTERPTAPTLETRHSTNLSPASDQTPTVSASVDLKSLIISLSLLISIVTVASFIWFALKRHRQDNAESSATTTMAEEEVTYSNIKHRRRTSRQAEEEAIYCNVGYMRKNPGQRAHAESDVDVMYSSVVTTKKKAVKRVEAEGQDVTYSMLALHH